MASTLGLLSPFPVPDHSMFHWRLKLWEAKLAAGQDRLEEASRLLAEPGLRQFFPAQRVAASVAGKLLDRARRQFADGQSATGWRDLQIAEHLGGRQREVDLIRQDVVEAAMHAVRRHLAMGQPRAALDRLTTLARRGARTPAIETWSEVCRLWIDAADCGVRGEFRRAIAGLEQAVRHVEHLGTMDVSARLQLIVQEWKQTASEHERAMHEMHAAATDEQWSAALAAADRALTLAPQDRTALRVRRRAWQAIGLDVTLPYRHHHAGLPVSLRHQQMGEHARRISTRLGQRSGEDDTVSGKRKPERRLIWVDAVGGFLVCLDDEITLGQPSTDLAPDVPILADLSRRHAVLRRQNGSYVLEAVQDTQLDGRQVTGLVSLGSEHQIQLGDSVRIHFCRPHALSSTARLVILSHHRTEPSVDAVLLMAESCILGPRKHSHIRCRDWQHDLILFRQAGGLACRADGPLTVNGAPTKGARALSAGSRIEGEDFALTIEET